MQVQAIKNNSYNTNFKGKVDNNITTALKREVNAEVDKIKYYGLVDKYKINDEVCRVQTQAKEALISCKTILSDCHPDTVLQITCEGEKLDYKKVQFMRFKRWLYNIFFDDNTFLERLTEREKHVLFPYEELMLVNKQFGTYYRISSKNKLGLEDFNLNAKAIKIIDKQLTSINNKDKGLISDELISKFL